VREAIETVLEVELTAALKPLLGEQHLSKSAVLSSRGAVDRGWSRSPSTILKAM
jgi:hypothetical protein